MTRRVYFPFHYKPDISRANVVRNSWVTQEREAAGFIDASLWEDAKTQGEEAVKALIRGSLKNTSVTAVLIGEQTANRPAVHYEIQQSIDRGNGILGIRIDQIKDLRGDTSQPGPNPLDEHYVSDGAKLVPLSSVVPTYDWVADDGYQNLGHWVEDAAVSAGRGRVSVNREASGSSSGLLIGLGLAALAMWAIHELTKPPTGSS